MSLFRSRDLQVPRLWACRSSAELTCFLIEQWINRLAQKGPENNEKNGWLVRIRTHLRPQRKTRRGKRDVFMKVCAIHLSYDSWNIVIDAYEKAAPFSLALPISVLYEIYWQKWFPVHLSSLVYFRLGGQILLATAQDLVQSSNPEAKFASFICHLISEMTGEIFLDEPESSPRKAAKRKFC